MTKRDIVMKVAAETGIIQQDVHLVLQKTLDHITDALAQGKNVELRNFGVFEVQTRKSRIGRNPNKPSHVVTIPTRKVVKFKMGKIMKQRVMTPCDAPNDAPQAPAPDPVPVSPAPQF